MADKYTQAAEEENGLGTSELTQNGGSLIVEAATMPTG